MINDTGYCKSSLCTNSCYLYSKQKEEKPFFFNIAPKVLQNMKHPAWIKKCQKHLHLDKSLCCGSRNFEREFQAIICLSHKIFELNWGVLTPRPPPSPLLFDLPVRLLISGTL